MNKQNKNTTPLDLSTIGNFTKNAIKSFENGIVNETNYLEKTVLKPSNDTKK